LSKKSEQLIVNDYLSSYRVNKNYWLRWTSFAFGT